MGFTIWVVGDFPQQVYRHREVEIFFSVKTVIGVTRIGEQKQRLKVYYPPPQQDTYLS